MANKMIKTKALLTKIANAFNDFKNAFKTETNWTSVTSAEGTVRYRIVKGMVVLNIYGLSPTTTWKTIATLPAAIRPVGTWIATQGYCGSYGRQNMTVAINPSNGEVTISTTSNTTSGSATVIYPQEG